MHKQRCNVNFTPGCYTNYDVYRKVEKAQEGPATHLRLVSITCRSYETKPDFAGPPRTFCIWLNPTTSTRGATVPPVPEVSKNLFSVYVVHFLHRTHVTRISVKNSFSVSMEHKRKVQPS